MDMIITAGGFLRSRSASAHGRKSPVASRYAISESGGVGLPRSRSIYSYRGREPGRAVIIRRVYAGA